MAAAFKDNRALPNILITGTPGTGKTTLSGLVAKNLGMKHGMKQFSNSH
jgi:broad-specificity NMP kinase